MRNRVVALAAVLCLAVFAGKKPAADRRQFLKQIPEDQKILQALNRLTFGPRPGDVQAVKAVGLKVWIDRQLHPESIPQNPALADKLKTMDTLAMFAIAALAVAIPAIRGSRIDPLCALRDQ